MSKYTDIRNEYQELESFVRRQLSEDRSCRGLLDFYFACALKIWGGNRLYSPDYADLLEAVGGRRYTAEQIMTALACCGEEDRNLSIPEFFTKLVGVAVKERSGCAASFITKFSDLLVGTAMINGDFTLEESSALYEIVRTLQRYAAARGARSGRALERDLRKITGKNEESYIYAPAPARVDEPDDEAADWGRVEPKAEHKYRGADETKVANEEEAKSEQKIGREDKDDPAVEREEKAADECGETEDEDKAEAEPKIEGEDETEPDVEDDEIEDEDIEDEEIESESDGEDKEDEDEDDDDEDDEDDDEEDDDEEDDEGTITIPLKLTFSFSSDSDADREDGGSGVSSVPPPEDESFESLLDELNGLVGLDSVKRDVLSLMNFIKIAKLREQRGMRVPTISYHLVFTGNPGTGKTTVARLVAKLYYHMGVLPQGQLVEADRSSLVAGYLGQTAIKTQEVIQKALGGVLFIDEAYSLAGDDKDAYGSEAIETILKAMEDHRDELVVIVAGYTELMRKFINSNPGLSSRFVKYFEFPDYSGGELLAIFNRFCEKNGYNLRQDASEALEREFDRLYAARDERFGNARAARNIFERAINEQANRISAQGSISDEDLVDITAEDVLAAIGGDEK